MFSNVAVEGMIRHAELHLEQATNAAAEAQASFGQEYRDKAQELAGVLNGLHTEAARLAELIKVRIEGGGS